MENKKNIILMAVFVVGAILAFTVFIRTATKEALAQPKQGPKIEIVGYTGRSFTHEGTTMVEVTVKNPDGTYSTMFCPCIQGSTCWPKCAPTLDNSK